MWGGIWTKLLVAVHTREASVTLLILQALHNLKYGSCDKEVACLGLRRYAKVFFCK